MDPGPWIDPYRKAPAYARPKLNIYRPHPYGSRRFHIGGSVSVKAREVDCTVRSGLRQGDPDTLQVIDEIIEAEKDPHTRTKKFIEISVADTGIGIYPEDQTRIFSPFDQVDSSSSRKFAGTGLGLSLSKRLVELHGGRIWVESAGEGKGSIFSFIIPI